MKVTFPEMKMDWQLWVEMKTRWWIEDVEERLTALDRSQEGAHQVSYVIVRGSVPIYWMQLEYKYIAHLQSLRMVRTLCTHWGSKFSLRFKLSPNPSWGFYLINPGMVIGLNMHSIMTIPVSLHACYCIILSPCLYSSGMFSEEK